MTDRELMQQAFERVTGVVDAWTNQALMQSRNGFIQGWEAARLAQSDHSEDKLEMVLKSQQEPLIDMSYDAVIKRCLPEKPKQQPEPEPVAHCIVRPLRGDESYPKTEIIWAKGQPVAGLLYTAPPQREWQGLTPEEAKEISLANRPYVIDMIAALEAKLKEKNHG